MRKKLLIFNLLLLIIVPAVSFSGGDSANGPKAVLRESVYKFQPVVEGITVAHEFTFQNNGDASLEILDIESG